MDITDQVMHSSLVLRDLEIALRQQTLADVDEVGVEALVQPRAAVVMVVFEKVEEYEGGSEGKDNGHTDVQSNGLTTSQVDVRESRESSV